MCFGPNNMFLLPSPGRPKFLEKYKEKNQDLLSQKVVNKKEISLTFTKKTLKCLWSENCFCLVLFQKFTILQAFKVVLFLPWKSGTLWSEMNGGCYKRHSRKCVFICEGSSELVEQPPRNSRSGICRPQYGLPRSSLPAKVKYRSGKVSESPFVIHADN